MPSPVSRLEPPASARSLRPRDVVLDTNVVLDWLLFRDPSCEHLAAQLTGRQLTWHATPAMRAELAHVLPRPQLTGWRADGESVLAQFDRWCRLRPPALLEPGACAPRCSDPDDQMFIDLACAVGARWLLSRDRALLSLRKPAWAHGVEVLPPADWARRYAGSADEVAADHRMPKQASQEA